MKTLYHVVSRNFGGTTSLCFSGTRAECRHWIIGRHRHIPPFYAITQRTKDFHKCFCTSLSTKY